MQESDGTFPEQMEIIDDKLISQDETQSQLTQIGLNRTISKAKKQIKRKRNKRLKRSSWKIIEYPFKSSYIYMLTGHILAEIKLDDENFWHIGLDKYIKEKEYYDIYVKVHESITDFEPLIYAMRHSQSIELYQMSEDLQSYKGIFKNSISMGKVIQKQVDQAQLQQLQEQRYNFKVQYIKEYIQKNLNQEDFYIIGNVEANIDQGYSSLKNIIFSKSYLDLVGIMENDFESSYFRSFLFFHIPPVSRRKFFESVLKGYTSGESEGPKEIKDFLIQTVEQINIYCDMHFKFIDIPYPSNMRFSAEIENLHKSMDNVILSTLSIKDYHLKTVLNIRKQGQVGFNLFDFEYYMHSSIFLDKFYQNQYNPFDYRQAEQDEEEDNKNRCSYRLIKAIN